MDQTIHFHAVPGVRLAATSAGIKQTQQNDLVLFEFAPGSQCCGMFTQNAFCAAPVTVARRHLQDTQESRYWLINSGNANAGTGEAGLKAVQQCCTAVAQQGNCAVESVLPFSTGVIGQPLPIKQITQAIPALFSGLGEGVEHWQQAAQAIMTTDTYPKMVSIQLYFEDQPITVSGIAKGAGMICPNMATLLAFVATNAAVETNALQTALTDAVNQSFNRITVDGDTSTNDACMLVATGQTQAPTVKIDEPRFGELMVAINYICGELAKAIVQDGEGATKFITIEVVQGTNEQECLNVAYTIAHSPLVKTAFFASDPNWGRILAAIGRAGLSNLNINDVKIFLNELCVVEQGALASSYSEEAGQKVMNEKEITIRVLLKRGMAHAHIWTTDLSYEYVKINAEYRT